MPDSRVAMFSRTMKNSKDGGTWNMLHRYILPEWIRNGMTHYTTRTAEGSPGPKVDGQTRTPYFRIRNCHGGESELMLFSLDYDGDIEDKLKEMQFSMIYYSELDKFRDRRILSVSLPSLRLPHLRFEQQQWIADTNPSEEGESSWIYEVWFVERIQTYEEYVKRKKEMGLPILNEPEFLNFQQSLDLIEIRPEENPWLDPRQLEELKTTYAYDLGLYSRYVEGKWVYGDGDKSRHFRGLFHPNEHLLGNCDSQNEEEWELANPSRNCIELPSGWDLGETNHAVSIMEKQMIANRSYFTIVDECVSLKEEVSIESFTEICMELIEALEAQAGQQFDLSRAWSDSSSIEKYSASGDTFPYLQVELASKGRIILQKGPKKSPGSVKVRVQLLKQLLKQNRIHVSAHCKFHIRMLRDLKKGMTPLMPVVPDENKHIFDALTYALMMECYEEMQVYQGPNVGQRSGATIVHI